MRDVKRCLLLAAVGLLAGVAESANAGVVFYTDRAAWLSAAGTPTFTEDFESFVQDTPFRSSPVALNGMTIQQLGVDEAFRNEVDVIPIEFPPPSGSNVASLYTNATGANEGTQVQIAFDVPTVAFGFDAWLSDVLEGAILEVYEGGALVGSQEIGPEDGAFLGYVMMAGQASTSVRFVSSTLNPGRGGEGFNIDNLAGVAVPEPSTLVLTGIGLLLGVAGVRRRGRRAA